jgi:hypothetical protein
MSRPVISEIPASPAEVLTRLTEWTTAYRSDPCPGAVVDVLVSFAFLVGLQAAARRPEATHRVLRQIAQEQPSAFQKSADVSRALFEAAAGGGC